MVVPGSSRLITEEGEHALYSVTLFKKVIEEFKQLARENKFAELLISSIFFKDSLSVILCMMKSL